MVHALHEINRGLDDVVKRATRCFYDEFKLPDALLRLLAQVAGKQCLIGNVNRVLPGDKQPVTYPDALCEYARHLAGEYAFNILPLAGRGDRI